MHQKAASSQSLDLGTCCGTRPKARPLSHDATIKAHTSSVHNTLPLPLLHHMQGHSLDAASASSALTALQAEEAWPLSGPLLASCLDAGIVVQPLVLQHILLVATHDRAWRAAKEVLQVCRSCGRVHVWWLKQVHTCWQWQGCRGILALKCCLRRSCTAMPAQLLEAIVHCVTPPQRRLQVASAAHQLDDVARLLRETRTELQKLSELQDASGISSSLNQTLMQRPGLVTDGDGLDQLLFLTYLQAQYSNGGWSEAIQLFKQLQQVRIVCITACKAVAVNAGQYCCRHHHGSESSMCSRFVSAEPILGRPAGLVLTLLLGIQQLRQPQQLPSWAMDVTSFPSAVACLSAEPWP